ncbi:MAG: peptide transporter [Lentisphaeria bacterium]|nr:peptide transporter [Lentisphaeria bacterium]
MINLEKKDKELEEFRSIMDVPTEFRDGFSMSSLLGALFLALVMIPGALYMELVAGLGIGPAAQWVTVILFVEIAKRANRSLNRAQLFVLFYICGLIVGQSVHGTPLFRQFLVQSDAATSFGINADLPIWVAPSSEKALTTRTFFQWEWLPVLGLIAFQMFFGRLNTAIMGYGLFHQTSDKEKLPFPMAPVGAQGIVALAEQVEGKDGGETQSLRRWRIFCIGGAVGMAFGAIYMGLPTISGALFGKPLQVFPIPFVDWSGYTRDVLPAVATGLSFDLGQVVVGMVMPFYAMLGSFIGLIITMVANPLLYYGGILTTYEKGDSTVEILFKNNIDFYFSFGIGISLAIAVIGIWGVVRNVRKADKSKREDNIPEGRGDIPARWVLTAYVGCTLAYILLSGWLVGWHRGVMIVLVFFGFLYTPLISYVSAKLEGLVGQVIEIPFIRELSFILSGYKGVAIWFIPVPKQNFGSQVVFYRQAELLGTRFMSIWKANIILFPIIIISMICFSSFIWGLAPIPSAQYPYTQQIWELEAKNTCLLYSSTMGEFSPFEKALSGPKVGLGFGVAMTTAWCLSALNVPIMLFYGVIRGLGQTMPHVVLIQFFGACLGRFKLQKKFGKDWRKIIPIFSAGYMVGAGLVSMVAIGIVFLTKAATTLPY